MPTPSIDEFWQLLAASTLLSPPQIAELQAEFQKLRGAAASGNARTLGEWLIDRRAISRFQCEVLLLGQTGPFRFGDYVLWDRLSGGRLRGLFRALHGPTGQRVLLKFLNGPAAGDAARLANLAETANRWSQLDDGHVATCVELLDAGQYRCFVVQDLVGVSAAELLHGEGRMTPSEACAAARRAATALAEIHNRGLTHGDVRPENIWCESKPAAPTERGYLLLGFPLARDPLGPPAGLDLWTADYAAPELAENNPPTPRSDVYALGCTLYQLLTGRPPFDSGPLQRPIAEKMQRHATEPIVPIDDSGPKPDGLNRVVSFMMAKNPAVRYPDMATVLMALAPYVDGPAQGPAANSTRSNGMANLKRYCRQRPSRESQATAAQPRVFPTSAGATQTPALASPPAPTGLSTSSVPATFPNLVPAPQFVPDSFGSAAAGPIAIISEPRRRRRSNNVLPVLVVAGVLGLIVALILGFALNRGLRDTPSTQADKNGEGSTAVVQSTPDGAATKNETPVDPVGKSDDGKSLWASPTHGPPPQIRYLAPGAQILAVVRPQSLLGTPQGRETIDAMGPAGPWLMSWIETQTGIKPERIDRLDIALYESFGPQLVTSVVAYVKDLPPEAELVAAWRNPSPTEKNGHRYFLQGDLCRYLPPGRKDVIVVAPREQMDDILAAKDALATLDPNMQLLVDGGDSTRHVNVYFLPIYVRAARDTLYPGTLGPMREGLDWFLGPSEELQAAALSFELSDPMFAELRVYPALSKKPNVMARDLRARVDEFSRRVQEHLVTLSISSYSRPTLAQYPFMLQGLAQHTRHGHEGRIAVVRSYLPGDAAANLALGADLLLLETTGTTLSPQPSSKPMAKSIWDRLKQSVTITFERDSLENALKQLSTEMGVKIEILGNDLKLDGITKNQPLGLDMKNKPAEEVLGQIMLQANPDRTVKNLSDDVQKLVYVVKPAGAGGEDVVLITTRSKASERGELPPIFKKK